jgi:hypothetical protein
MPEMAQIGKQLFGDCPNISQCPFTPKPQLWETACTLFLRLGKGRPSEDRFGSGCHGSRAE